MDRLARFWRHDIVVRRAEDAGSRGGNTLGDDVTVRGMWDVDTELAMSSTEDRRVFKGAVFFPFETPTIPLESELEYDGRVVHVIGERHLESADGPNHYPITVGP